jgi:hypothetical protein
VGRGEHALPINHAPQPLPTCPSVALSQPPGRTPKEHQAPGGLCPRAVVRALPFPLPPILQKPYHPLEPAPPSTAAQQTSRLYDPTGAPRGVFVHPAPLLDCCFEREGAFYTGGLDCRVTR